ncbi:5-formyltetrahydrofolate cyclo-ligase [Alteracholeplasma palmae J233]|uniref:5-formyltetrahydrofolate cyclo-ligase n=1 Tax=Alteracholeplasma palmae (strain ATCC 49389 / J233) TaxID=1318466 RepID=U4KNC9_ALTPJ|nr:5-formyltetrahydrofolate cyclo-ligase [Alteracholeplasma palmae]CCV63685.1 5-formyltetrahydrofolate cyclo-ligase [Alteracholeplasma palmae J233]
MLSKDNIRKELLEYRKTLNEDIKNKSAKKVIDSITNDSNFKSSNYVGLYMPIAGEIDLTSLIEMYPEKIYAFPKMVNKKIVYYKYNEKTDFELSNFNVPEIKAGENITDKLDYILVPAIALNKEGYRVGFGKGYFDMFFKEHTKCIRVGITYEFSIKEFIPESHDIKMNYYFIG